MKLSQERLAMLDDIHSAGSVSINELAQEYDVTTRSVYGWLENGFPLSWTADDHETFRRRFIRITGGAHLMGYWHSLTAPADTAPTDLMMAASDAIAHINQALRKLIGTEAVALSEAERMDVYEAITRTETDIARIRAAVAN